MAALVEQIRPLHHRCLEVIYGITDVGHQKLTKTTTTCSSSGGHGTAWAAFETGGGDKVDLLGYIFEFNS